jgi:hypothetical protein
MPAQRHVRWSRLSGLAVLLLCLLGADCNDNIVDDLVPGGGDECPPGNPTAVLAMDPEPDWLVLGGTLEVTVRIYQGCDVAGVPFKLRSNPEHLRFDSGVLGPFMASEGGNVSFLVGEDTQQPGVISVGMTVLNAGPDGALAPDGNGDLCTLTFDVLPAAVLDGETSIEPFMFKVFQPGLVEQPAIFPLLTIQRTDR